jgi:5-methylcytosine-specific restriction endonuclease McrA
LTVPRGDAAPAQSGASPAKAEKASGNARVFVLSKHKAPLMPTTSARARELQKKGRAVVVRLFPYTIRLKDRDGGKLQPIVLKFDPGSKYTGIALIREADGTVHPLWLSELQHRGRQISEALTGRKGCRKGRRSRNLRYREPRFDHRTKPIGWLAPSLRHRVESTMSWVNRLHQFVPLIRIDCELVRFDMQLLENSEISGIEYQRGELAGYEVKEYLLEKWGRACVYCGKEDVPLQREHIQAKARSGSNRSSNLTLSCGPCNQKKGAQPIEIFLKKKPTLLAKILATAKKPLRDAAAVNATRWALVAALQETGIPVCTYSGGRTKWNRSRLGIPKTHALDAVCVGVVTKIGRWELSTLCIKSMGRGAYQRTRVTSEGFPRGYLTRQKRIFGFQTGDMVRADVVKGKKIGRYTGRVAVRSTGSFNIQTSASVVEGISHKACRLLARGDGYFYALRTEFLHAVNDGVSTPLEKT